MIMEKVKNRFAEATSIYISIYLSIYLYIYPELNLKAFSGVSFAGISCIIEILHYVVAYLFCAAVIAIGLRLSGLNLLCCCSSTIILL